MIEKLRIVLQDFKQSSKFTRIKKKILKDSPSFCYIRKMDPFASKSAEKKFYSEEFIKAFCEEWKKS